METSEKLPAPMEESAMKIVAKVQAKIVALEGEKGKSYCSVVRLLVLSIAIVGHVALHCANAAVEVQMFAASCATRLMEAHGLGIDQQAEILKDVHAIIDYARAEANKAVEEAAATVATPGETVH